ncbi:MAG: cyclic 2,3-diphosphoglycerate synthase [Nanoarchaeota archaeon]|nr:cyclic 2,3-diphosphoglycerate synthase [Nanoarchaeota archaeon]MCG2717367.1 cyclic 2,3-diphosphoglycerate synthase [Nanoarchaeota archaeon]
MKKRIIIMGAAGRDFHNFNVCYRSNEDYEVVAFTATQIPNIEGRIYPAVLAGKLYPKGIPIHPEEELIELIKKEKIDEVVFSYSDVTHEYVMHKASEVNSAGATFKLLGAEETMIKSSKPVISICAVRTGCGKSQTTRRVAEILKKKGKKLVVIRHPMPYGKLEKQICQRFATYQDMLDHDCTIEEMEEYEPHIKEGIIVYAGVDYEKIIREAEKEADVILWDGGNNDTPFYKPDIEIVVMDPHRAGHELRYYPGETNFRRADVLVINKMDSADPPDVQIILDNIQEYNPKAIVVKANSEVKIDSTDVNPEKILIIEDGPTLTHGGMAFGAGIVAAQKFYPDAKILEPESFAVGSIKKLYKKFPNLKDVLPAMGYFDEQMKELQQTINNSDADLVVVATPIDLQKLIKIGKPHVRVHYTLVEIGDTDLEEVLKDF